MRGFIHRTVPILSIIFCLGIQLAHAQEKDFHGQSFVDRDFRGQNLAGANFEDADLTGARFDDAIISGANLQNANLTRASFSRADLSGADLRGAEFALAAFQEANLSRANLEEVDLKKASLFRAKLRGANLQNAKGIGHLDYADFREANLCGANLLEMVDYNGTSAKFSGAKYDANTRWPPSFDVRAAKAVLVETATPSPAVNPNGTPVAPPSSPAMPRNATSPRTAAAPTDADASREKTYQAGERIEVNTLGSWDKAVILEVGSGEHEGEFKVHYDGYSDAYDRWLRAIYFRKVAGATRPPSAPKPGESRPATVPSVPAPSAGQTVGPGGEKGAQGGPRLGIYKIFSFGAVGRPPLFLGHFELMEGGKYRASRTSKADYYGQGEFRFSAGKVVWLSGPYKDDGFDGAFKVEENGVTHKITLRKGTVATNTPQ